MPVPNALWSLSLNTAGPFTDIRLRQAVAWALPYDKIMQASLFGRGIAMSGRAGKPDTAWPQPFPYAQRRRARRRWSRKRRAGGLRDGADLRRRRGDDRRADGRAHQGGARRRSGSRSSCRRSRGRISAASSTRRSTPWPSTASAAGSISRTTTSSGTSTATTRSSTLDVYQNPEMDKLIDAARFAPDQSSYHATSRLRRHRGARRAGDPDRPAAARRRDAKDHRGLPVLEPSREPDFRYLTKG